jgi:hypothetical protein
MFEEVKLPSILSPNLPNIFLNGSSRKSSIRRRSLIVTFPISNLPKKSNDSSGQPSLDTVTNTFLDTVAEDVKANATMGGETASVHAENNLQVTQLPATPATPNILLSTPPQSAKRDKKALSLAEYKTRKISSPVPNTSAEIKSDLKAINIELVDIPKQDSKSLEIQKYESEAQR